MKNIKKEKAVGKYFIPAAFIAVLIFSVVRISGGVGDEYGSKKSFEDKYGKNCKYVDGYVYNSCEFDENKLVFVCQKSFFDENKMILMMYGMENSVKEKLKEGRYVRIHNPSKYISEIKEARNFGEFDRKEYLASKNIKYQLSPDNESIEILKDKMNVRILSSKARNSMHNVMLKTMGEQNAGVAMAIITGDTAGISQTDEENYKNSGISHILAVSGMHVGFVQSTLNKLFSRKRISYSARCAIIIFFLIIFGYFADFSPSVTRAVLQSSYLLFSKVIRRPAKKSNSLLFACTVQLISNPFNLLGIGFILSYVAATSLVVIQPMLSYREFKFGKIPRWLLPGLSVNIGMFPLIVLFFNSFSPIGIIATLFAGKAAYAICISGLGIWLASFLPFGSILSGLLASITSFAIMILNKISITGSGLPPPISTLTVPSMSKTAIVIYYALVLLLLNKNALLFLRKRPVAAILAIILPVLAFTVNYLKTELVFFDVGQGLSVLYKNNGICGLVDTGDGKTDVSTLLYKQGVGEIDFVLLTHGHNDHTGGFEKVASEHKIKVLFVPENSADEGIASACLIAKEKGIQVIAVSDEYSCSIGNVRLDMYLNENACGSDGVNNASVVMIASSPDGKAVFTGDIEAETESYMAEMGRFVEAEILQVAHHGSETSTIYKNISIISPEYAIISVGENNNYGHPAKRVLETLEKVGATVKRNDLCGAVRVTLRKGNISVWQKLKTSKQ